MGSQVAGKECRGLNDIWEDLRYRVRSVIVDRPSWGYSVYGCGVMDARAVCKATVYAEVWMGYGKWECVGTSQRGLGLSEGRLPNRIFILWVSSTWRCEKSERGPRNGHERACGTILRLKRKNCRKWE